MRKQKTEIIFDIDDVAGVVDRYYGILAPENGIFISTNEASV